MRAAYTATHGAAHTAAHTAAGQCTLSVVVPVLDEAAGIEATLRALAPLRMLGAEVIVVDGGSRDATAALAAPCADHVLLAPCGRARQMNAGAAQARGDALLFLHADTLLPDGAEAQIRQALERGAAWGRFDVRIAGRSGMLRVVAACMNARSRWTGIATGDQALMEDIELSRRLRGIGRPACLRARVTTSGRRWETRGVWRTIVLMWRLRWRYWRGESPQSLARAYR
jgi:glycosyltransferase involved in cell wall biosynthesis